LPFGTEALAVICPLLIDGSQDIFSACMSKFANLDFLLPNVEKWVLRCKKMLIYDSR